MWLLRKLAIPPALVAGIGLLLLGPEGALALPDSLYSAYRAWPGFLISFLFVGIILSDFPVQAKKDSGLYRAVAAQTLFVYFIGVTELALGLALVLGLLSHTGMPVLAGHIIEIGWIGGHGAAAAFSGVAARLNQPAAGSLSIFSATVGLIVGAGVGLALVNWIRRRDRKSSAEMNLDEAKEGPETNAQTLSPASDGSPQRHLPVALGLFVVCVLAAFLVRTAIASLLTLGGHPSGAQFAEEFPLFSLALLVALALRHPLKRVGLYTFETANYCRAITGIVLDALICSATATLSLAAASEHIGSFAILMMAATVWVLLLFLVFAPLFLPAEDRQELALLNFGMSTGVTAIGLMLVRSLRKEVSPRVARVYGLAAPLSAPVIGGGVVSLLLPQWTSSGHGWLVVASLVVSAALFLFIARLLRIPQRQ